MRSILSYSLLFSCVAACADGEEVSTSFGTQSTTTSTTTSPATGMSTTTVEPTTSGSPSTDSTDPTTTTTTTTTTDSATGVEPPIPMCGDGMVEGLEECDEGGNNSDMGACTAECKNAVCGDGLVYTDAEACDDGNMVDDDACTNICAAAQCGDGLVGPGEECDDGNMDDNDTCTNACTMAQCGDGIVGPGEACDDGNMVNNDACTTACKSATCGDMAIQPGEQCDDGNMVDTDACLGTCLKASCGDGVVQAGVEECDDGNNSNLDPCVNTCKKATCSDMLKSDKESDVDCGGGTCNPCNKGKSCGVDGDCATGACVNGSCNLPTSCKQLKNGLPATPNGIYQIDIDGDGPKQPFDVYCEMTVDGGGWILVGRSRNTPSMPGCAGTDGGGNFGWRSAQGSLADDNNAYSMDVANKGLVFTQVLFGNHSGSKAFNGVAYRQTVVADFINVHLNTHYYIGEPTPVLGPCNTGMAMFSWMGFTSNTDTFHFRDVDGNGFGLTASGFRSCYDTCLGGNLNGAPGLVFVR